MKSPSSPEQPQPPDAALEDAAIAWLTEREDGFTPALEREFAQWLGANPRHAATLARLEQTLGLLHELPQFRAELNTEFDRAAPVVPFPHTAGGSQTASDRWPRSIAWVGAVAVLTLALLVGWRAWLTPSIAHYGTTVAGYERAQLDDGSTVELNSASTMRVQFTPAERRVELKSGEAHFAVAHDTARPFVVSVGGVSVRAVGTAFNVRITADEAVEVIVIEGKVRVGSTGPESSGGATAPLVAAGERVVLRPQLPLAAAEKVPAEMLRSALAWQSRLADFDEAPLAAVVERFNARSRVQLVLADRELGARPIGGTFALDESEAFVRLLTRDGELVAERRGETEILLRRAP
jgi:transmembrane sensor